MVWQHKILFQISSILLFFLIFSSEVASAIIPPVPINLSQTNGTAWINYTWINGTGNITNSYNISLNGVWHNETTNKWIWGTTNLQGWLNITVQSYNNSGNGSINATALSMNTHIDSKSNPLIPIEIAALGAGAAAIAWYTWRRRRTGSNPFMFFNYFMRL